MAGVNTRHIKQLLSNPFLIYGMLKSSSELAAPLVLDEHYNLGIALYDQYDQPLKTIDSKLRVTSTPYGYDIVDAGIDGHALWRMSGAATGIDNTYETVWSNGGQYVFPNVPMQMELVSGSIQDSSGAGVNPAGTGVHYVIIYYLDANWDEQTEIVALDGTTVVTTTATDIYRVNNMLTYPEPSIGANQVAAGNIDLRNLANTPIYCRIPVGFNNPFQAIYSVPRGKSVFITALLVSSGSDGGGHFVKSYIRSTRGPTGSVVGLWYTGGLVATEDASVYLDLPIPGKFGQRTDFEVRAVSDNVAASAEISVEYIGWIEDD